jgi:hypothetical protein
MQAACPKGGNHAQLGFFRLGNHGHSEQIAHISPLVEAFHLHHLLENTRRKVYNMAADWFVLSR